MFVKLRYKFPKHQEPHYYASANFKCVLMFSSALHQQETHGTHICKTDQQW